MDYDKTRIPENYDRGRDHGPAVLDQWMRAVAAHVDALRVRTILDVGCGTGRFTLGLASCFDAIVIGVDPSRKMLHEALSKPPDPRVFFAEGMAEALPLASDSIDLIFISMVFHHFGQPRQAAQECERVLRRHGRLCLRTGCSDNIPSYPYVPFFSASRSILEQRLPSLALQREIFESASLRHLFSGLITQQVAPDYKTYAEKLATKSDSVLSSLDDAQFDAGLAALLAAAPAGPVEEAIDFVVFEKG